MGEVSGYTQDLYLVNVQASDVGRPPRMTPIIVRITVETPGKLFRAVREISRRIIIVIS